MALAGFKVSKDEQITEESLGSETEAKTVISDEPIDPRPLPMNHNRHLDVNKILERSLPRVSGEG
jgi:hypothetical protein